jgi:preprotein translocase subunit SecG
MEWLETAVIVVHVIVSLGLIGLVMLQQGKGAEAGASFGGGASQTVFGSQGSGTFMTRMTKYLAIVFFITSISLAVIAKQKSEIAADDMLAPIAELETVSAEESSEPAVELEAKTPEIGESESAAPELE